MSFSLINSLFAYAFVCVSIPIIIHLLFKRQFKTINWAAIHFLLEAEKRIKRKLKLIELLMLLLRILAVIILVLLFARLVFDPMAFGASKFLGIKQWHHYLIDDSPSMGAKHQNDAYSWTKAKGFLKNQIEQMVQENQSQTISIYTSSSTTPIIHQIELNEANATKIYAAIDGLNQTSKKNENTKSFDFISQLISKEDQYHHRFNFISDYRKNDWGSYEQKELKTYFEELKKTFYEVNLFDVGASAYQNLTIESIQLNTKNVISEVPITIEVTVANYSLETFKSVPIKLSVNEHVVVSKSLNEIKPNEKKVVAFSYVFNDLGFQKISVEIENDDLENDNISYLAIKVIDGLKVLIVDGDRQSSAKDSESYFLKHSLSPDGSYYSGISVVIKTEDEFSIASLDEYQVIYLCNVARLGKDKLDELKLAVESGKSLIISLGDQIDLDFYQKQFYQEGRGLLPGIIKAVKVANENEFYHFGKIDFAHPILQLFNDDKRRLLIESKFYSFFQVEVTSDSKTLISFNDDKESPAYIEKTVDKGKVLLFTSTFDRDWTSWPADISYLIMQLETISYCQPDRLKDYKEEAGHTLLYHMPRGESLSSILVKTPHQESRSVLTIDENNLKEGNYLFNGTNKAGFYHIYHHNEDLKPQVIFSVNQNTQESQLQQWDTKNHISNLSMEGINYFNIDDSQISQDSNLFYEFWKGLCLALIAILLLEILIGYWLGGKR